MANFPRCLSVGVGGSGGVSSSSSDARAPANKDFKMQSAEQHVLNLINPDLRENALLELSKVYSSHHRGNFHVSFIVVSFYAFHQLLWA